MIKGELVVKITCDGIVLYADGSFRRNQAGWGVHGYAYADTPLTVKQSEKQLPTKTGYQVVELSASVTPVQTIDAYGPVPRTPTNNTAELQAAISAFGIAEQYETQSLLILTDSEYVRKNLDLTKRWAKSNWLKADGQPYANKDYWQELVAARDSWCATGRAVEIKWVKGHNGNLGNERADTNARLGSGGKPVEHTSTVTPSLTKVKLEEVNPLIMKTRMLFTVDGNPPNFDGFYYFYHLGRLHKYGHKQDDTELDKIRKTDLILGRRNSEACYCVYKPKETEPYLETLKINHAAAFYRDVIDLGVVRLDVAYKANVREKIESMGDRSLVHLESLKALVTPRDELVSITLDPPRLAMDAVARLNIMRRRLEEAMEKRLGEGTLALDVTDLLFEKVQSGKKEITKLHKTITSATQAVEYQTEIKGVKTVLKLVTGLDIPNRNALAKIAALDPKVTVLVVANGPMSYSFSTVFETDDGAAIYESPDMQFVLKA